MVTAHARPTSDVCPTASAHALTSLLIEAVKDICNADAASILRLQPDGSLVFELVSGGAGDTIKQFKLEPGEGVAGRVAKTRTPVRFGNGECASRCAFGAGEDTGYITRSILAAPLIGTHGEVIGVVQALNAVDADEFTEDDLHKLSQLCAPITQALTAIERFTSSGEGGMDTFYRAMVMVQSLRTAHLQQQRHELEDTRRAFEISKAQAYSDEKMLGLARMASGIAHEINNPISVVVSNMRHLGEYASDLAEAMRRIAHAVNHPSASDAQKVEVCSKALAEADAEFVLGDLNDLVSDCQENLGRVTQIVQRLLLFGDSERDRVEELDLSFEVNRVVELVARSHHSSDKLVVIDPVVSEVPALFAARPQVHQILMELVDNAVRAAVNHDTQPDPRVSVRTFADKTHVHVAVEDNGPGIPAEIQDRIFDPFYTTKSNWRSTGLGLSAVYGVVKSLDGLIAVESAMGAGTLITVSFPRRDRATAEANRSKSTRERGHRKNQLTGRYYEDMR